MKNKSIADHVEELMQEKSNKKLVTQKMLANHLGIDESAISKCFDKKKKPRDFTPDEITKLKDFFDVSYDRLFTGIETENQAIHNDIQLNNCSIEWLKRAQKQNPEYIDLLNIILSHDKIAETIFKTFLICVNRPMIKIDGLLKMSDTTVIDTEMSTKLIDALCMQYISRAMDLLSNQWIELYAIKTTSALNKRLKNCDSEARKRIIYKFRQQHKNFKFEKVANEINETLKIEEYHHKSEEKKSL